MKKSMPTARFAPTPSVHCPQTIFGKTGWPFRRIAPLPVDAWTGPVSAGVVSRNSETPVWPSADVAPMSRRYVLEKVRPVTVAWCSVPVTVGAVQTTGASRPYATRAVAGSVVSHASVAENGVRDTVRTFSIFGGGPVGAAGVVIGVVCGRSGPAG